MSDRMCNASFLGPEEYQDLEKESDFWAYNYSPVIIFLVLIMITGVVGNVIVMYVYLSLPKRKPSNWFLICMAIFDFLASSVALPLDIYDMRFHYTFYNNSLCKSFRYFETVATNASTIILILIAIDRYMKICLPLHPSSHLRNKLMCAAAGIVGIFLAIPALWLFDVNRVPITGQLFCGFDCTISSKYIGTLFQRVYFCFLMSTFFITVLILIVVYVKIWIVIKESVKKTIGDGPLIGKTKSNPNMLEEERIKCINRGPNKNFPCEKNPAQNGENRNNTSIKSNASSILTKLRCTRTTKIFITVSAAFIVSFLPSIIVNLVQVYIRSNSTYVKIMLKLFARFHFINHAVNPLIYSFMNVNFRKQCVKSYRQIISACAVKLNRKTSVSSRSSRTVKTKRQDISLTLSYKK